MSETQLPVVTPTERKWLLWAFFIAWWAALCYRVHAHVSSFQLSGAVLKNPYVDATYWLAHLSRLADAIAAEPEIGLRIDIALFTVPILVLMYPKRIGWLVIFWVCFLFYYFTFNSYSLSHTHCLTGFLLIPIAFFTHSPRGQYLLWQGLRYYACWIFGAAFLWKLCRGYFWAVGNGAELIRSTRAGFLAEQPDTPQAEVLRWLIAHPALCDALMIGGGLLQGMFWIGFFTRRYDRWLLAGMVVFHTATYLLMDIVFFELLVFALPFLLFISQEKRG